MVMVPWQAYLSDPTPHNNHIWKSALGTASVTKKGSRVGSRRSIPDPFSRSLVNVTTITIPRKRKTAGI